MARGVKTRNQKVVDIRIIIPNNKGNIKSDGVEAGEKHTEYPTEITRAAQSHIMAMAKGHTAGGVRGGHAKSGRVMDGGVCGRTYLLYLEKHLRNPNCFNKK